MERGDFSKEMVDKIWQKQVSSSCKCNSTVKSSLIQLTMCI